MSGDCYECPIPLAEVLVQYAWLGAFMAVAALMKASRRQFISGLGWMAMVVILLWAISYTIAVTRWGIGNSAVPLRPGPRRVSWLILGALDLALAGGAKIIVNWRQQ